MRYETKATAQKAACKLRSVMDNPHAWKAEVWENIGWHFRLVCGTLTVFEGYDGTYSTLMSDSKEMIGVGEIYWTPRKSFHDPNKAVRHQLTLARLHRSKIQHAILRVEAELNA